MPDGSKKMTYCICRVFQFLYALVPIGCIGWLIRDLMVTHHCDWRLIMATIVSAGLYFVVKKQIALEYGSGDRCCSPTTPAGNRLMQFHVYKMSLAGKIAVSLMVIAAGLLIAEAYVLPPQRRASEPFYHFRNALRLHIDPVRTGFVVWPCFGFESRLSCGGQKWLTVRPYAFHKYLLRSAGGIVVSAYLWGHILAFLVKRTQHIMNRRRNNAQK